MSDRPEPLAIGTRVRHIGEQYTEAVLHGTGNIVEVVRYYPQDRTYEYLVQCDKPPLWSDKTLVERNHMVEVHVWANSFLPEDHEIRSQGKHEVHE